MYDDEEDTATEPPPSGALPEQESAAAVEATTDPRMPMGALTAMSAPEGLFAKADLIPMPADPVDPSLKWRAFSANALKGGTLAGGLSNAETAYVAQANKDNELRMRYIPLANQARQQRAAQQLLEQRNQQQMLAAWNKTLIGNAASLLTGDPGAVTPENVAAVTRSSVERGQVPPQLAQKFLEGLPKDPIELHSYLKRAAISVIDPFRGVEAPKFQNVAEGATLVQTNAQGGPKAVVQGNPKGTDLMKAITEVNKLDPNDPRRKDYENLITKLTTHNPNQTTIINPAKPLINELMGGLGTAIVASRANAEGSVATLETVGRLKDALDSGKVRAGPGTTSVIWLRQVGQVLSIPGRSADEMLTNTRSAIQSMARLELDAAQAMKGQGAITDPERAIIKKAAAGDIDSMTIPELRVLTDVLERTAKSKIGRYNSSLNRLKGIQGGDAVIGLLGLDDPSVREYRHFDAEGNPVVKKP